MPTVVKFTDRGETTRWRSATVALPTGENCFVLLGRRGVQIRRAVVGPSGPSLYREPDNAKVTVMALMLSELYPAKLLPDGFIDFNLSAFTNAVLHCRSCAAVEGIFQHILNRERETWPPPPWFNTDWMRGT